MNAVVRTVGAAIFVIVASQLLGHVLGCAAMKDAFFGPTSVGNPAADDAELFHCRMIAEIDHDMSHDAGGACHIYDDCVRDAGLRGDINYCGSVATSSDGGDQ
jgi:hypothetical protein